MAAVATIKKTHQLASGLSVFVGTIALDSSYPTGGEAIDHADVERFDVLTVAGGGGYIFEWDAPNQKLKLMIGDNNNAADAVAVEAANTTDVSALSALPFVAWGA
jgi:hypothetical protein